MTEIEERILKNQAEIMDAQRYLLKCAKPDLVGKNGELDRYLEDLLGAIKSTEGVIAGQRRMS